VQGRRGSGGDGGMVDEEERGVLGRRGRRGRRGGVGGGAGTEGERRECEVGIFRFAFRVTRNYLGLFGFYPKARQLKCFRKSSRPFPSSVTFPPGKSTNARDSNSISALVLLHAKRDIEKYSLIMCFSCFFICSILKSPCKANL
jgi:hypothetical protein